MAWQDFLGSFWVRTGYSEKASRLLRFRFCDQSLYADNLWQRLFEAEIRSSYLAAESEKIAIDGHFDDRRINHKKGSTEGLQTSPKYADVNIRGDVTNSLFAACS